MRSSTSLAFHVEPGLPARRRASHQAPAKPMRYMIPYQWTLTGPISMAIGLKPGYFSMAGGSLAELAGNAAEERLQVTRLGNRRMDRMIGRLAAGLEDLHKTPRVTGSGLDSANQLLRCQVIGARTGHEQPVPVDEIQGELIELPVCRLSLRNVLLTLDEGGRVENDDIETRTLRM